MASDPNKPDWQHTAARAAQRLRDLENVMRGMASRDFGNGRGQFVEPPRLREPVYKQMPEDIEILEAASSLFNISANPQISTPLFSDPSPAPQAEVPDAGLYGDLDDVLTNALPDVASDIQELMGQLSPGMEPMAPEVESPEFRPASFEDIPQAESPPIQPGPDVQYVDTEPPIPTQPLPGTRSTSEPRAPLFGVGRPAVDSSERERLAAEAMDAIKREREARRASQASQEASQPPPVDRSRPAPTSRERPPQAAAGRPIAQSPPQSGVGATADGFVPDFGDSGTTFYQPPSASQIGILQQAEAAADAADNWTEMIMEILRRLTANLVRHNELLSTLTDKLDSEEDTDEF